MVLSEDKVSQLGMPMVVVISRVTVLVISYRGMNKVEHSLSFFIDVAMAIGIES